MRPSPSSDDNTPITITHRTADSSIQITVQSSWLVYMHADPILQKLHIIIIMGESEPPFVLEVGVTMLPVT